MRGEGQLEREGTVMAEKTPSQKLTTDGLQNWSGADRLLVRSTKHRSGKLNANTFVCFAG